MHCLPLKREVQAPPLRRANNGQFSLRPSRIGSSTATWHSKEQGSSPEGERNYIVTRASDSACNLQAESPALRLMIAQLSLAATNHNAAVLSASNWLSKAANGPIAIAIATICVALFGLSLLTGRLSLRQGGLIVVGAFVTFASPAIASALLGASSGFFLLDSPLDPAPQVTEQEPIDSQSPQFVDPYAGASVPQ